VHEREARRHFPEPPQIGPEDLGPASSSDPFAFMDPRTPRLRYSMGD
jgi:hypothetical protein